MKDLDKYIIKIQNLEIGYKTKNNLVSIANSINLTIEKGKFVCLIGRNGIGKSTLLRTLTKVQPIINGEIFIEGKSIVSINSLDFSKKMSVVLTEKLPESNLTVYELISLGRQPYTNWIGKLNETDIQQIKTTINLLNINDLVNFKYYELSDGQLQKVLIARALVQDTPIIILDEPTAHLDIQHTMEIFQLLKNLSIKLNKTIIISTHQINLALQTSDEIWLMNEKELISGTSNELIENSAINTLFNTDNIEFDKETHQFKLKN